MTCDSSLASAEDSASRSLETVIDDGNSRDLLARMPSGEPISTEFLSRVLGGGPSLHDFHVDESSVIKGRHSTTFRLVLHRLEIIDGMETAERKDEIGGICFSAHRNDLNSPSATLRSDCISHVGSSQEVCKAVPPRDNQPSSIFVKRVVCRDLPERPLQKWRCEPKVAWRSSMPNTSS